MVYEWRCFEILKVEPKAEFQQKEIPKWKNSLPSMSIVQKFFRFIGMKYLEERSDLYLLLPCFTEETRLNYGLKFRDVTKQKNGDFVSKKLELKVRSSRDENGVESWTKVIQQRLSSRITLLKLKGSEPLLTAEKIPEETKESPEPLVSIGDAVYEFNWREAKTIILDVIMASDAVKPEMKSCLNGLETGICDTHCVLVNKLRWQGSLQGWTSENVIIECIHLPLDQKTLKSQKKKEGKMVYCLSKSLEGSKCMNKELITEFLKQAPKVSTEANLCQYPEFLWKIASSNSC